ncbi:MAG TPA: hypothetical protein VGY66_26430 [Gemmataceae bacterium]|nr:hypothetical protein [Gemmataceae bacterium]
MRRLVRRTELIPFYSTCALLIVLAALLAAAPIDDQSDTSKKDAKPAKKASKEKVRTDLLKGKLVKIDAKERTFTVRVTIKIPQDNAGAAQNIANLQRQLIGNRDPNSINSIRLEIMKNQQNLVTFKDDVKRIDCVANDDMKVRTLLLPVEYDDKGKPKRLTEKEKRALKGSDLKAPGYEADFESLKPEQTVEVHLEKAAHKSKSKDKDAADVKEPKKAIMIVIVSEPVK